MHSLEKHWLIIIMDNASRYTKSLQIAPRSCFGVSTREHFFDDYLHWHYTKSCMFSDKYFPGGRILAGRPGSAHNIPKDWKIEHILLPRDYSWGQSQTWVSLPELICARRCNKTIQRTFSKNFKQTFKILARNEIEFSNSSRVTQV